MTAQSPRGTVYKEGTPNRPSGLNLGSKLGTISGATLDTPLGAWLQVVRNPFPARFRLARNRRAPT